MSLTVKINNNNSILIYYIFTQTFLLQDNKLKINLTVHIDYNKTIKHLFCTYIYTENQKSFHCPVAGVSVIGVSVRRVNGVVSGDRVNLTVSQSRGDMWRFHAMAVPIKLINFSPNTTNAESVCESKWNILILNQMMVKLKPLV